MSDKSFLPTASRATMQRRAELLHEVRAFFHEQGFLEVETPSLSADTVVEQHIDPIAVTLPDDPRNSASGRELWLQTSPEFHMKRLLATGEYNAIFQICRCFRAGERGALHNPEFTMVEWYRAGDDMNAGIKLLADLCQAVLNTETPERLSYAEAFRRFANMNPFAALPDGERVSDEQLNLTLAEAIEPRLGRGRPTILYHYPASQASLAQVTSDEAGNAVAERFELYVNGIELANGYHELLDADELRQRNEANNQVRAGDQRPELPAESRLLTAMTHGLPACAGTALGLDRLVMVATGAERIEQVMPFPTERA